MFYTAKIQNWKQFTTLACNSCNAWCCVLHCKDTKLKAIHNDYLFRQKNQHVVFYTAKIQNWKQFTTNPQTKLQVQQLCFTLQRYKIESNSQLMIQLMREYRSCVLHCKDTKLKAIHNSFVISLFATPVVFYTAKIQNWKQFTTRKMRINCFR